eukprot:3527568-Rhodomonas_salina.1
MDYSPSTTFLALFAFACCEMFSVTIAYVRTAQNATKASSGPVTSGRLAGRWLTSTKAVAKNRAAAQTTSYPGPKP